MKPTSREAIEHLCQHFGLAPQETLALLKVPTHPAGMRDEFALAALSGALQVRALQALDFFDRAHWCYQQADAMMEARNANR